MFIYYHLVRAIKFPMLPKHHRVCGIDPIYELLDYAEDGIRFIFGYFRC